MVLTERSLPRLAMVHFSCPPIIGGVESVLATHARMFLDAGYPVTVIAGRGRRFDRRLGLHTVPIIDSRFDELEHVNAELGRGLVSPRFDELSREIELTLTEALHGIDVCIVHNALTLHFNLPLTAALHRIASRGRTQFIAWCHDLAWSNPLYLPSMRESEPWTLLKTPASHTRYVTISDFRSHELTQLLGSGAEVVSVPNGIQARHFLQLSGATAALLRQIQSVDRFPFLLLPARITRRKNIEMAIRITAALKANGAQPLLLVTGPPGPHNARSVDYVEELDALGASLGVREETVMLHKLRRNGRRHWRASDAMMSELYRVADALLFPSAQEGFGLPILEAGLARLPIFCANIQPFRELGESDVTLFELDAEPEDVAAQMLASLSHRAESRLRRRVSREFDWDIIFERQLRPLVDDVATQKADASRGYSHA